MRVHQFAAKQKLRALLRERSTYRTGGKKTYGERLALVPHEARIKALDLEIRETREHLKVHAKLCVRGNSQ